MEAKELNQEEVQTEETGAGDEPKVAEGYSHLTPEDLDPDYEKPTDKETEVENTESVQAEESENTVTEDKPEDSPSKVEEYQINGTTYTDDELQSRMVKDYSNLASHTGKQAEEIGKYKAKVEELQKRMESLTSEDGSSNVYGDKESKKEEKKEYDIYTEEGLRELSKDMAKEALLETKKIDSKKQEKVKIQSIAKEATNTFMKDHNLKDDSYITELVNFGNESGFQMNNVTSSEQVVNYLEHVHAMKSGDYTRFNKGTKEAIPKVDTTTMEKVSEAQKVQKGLGNVNSSESDNVDYDAMSYDDWEKLPRDKRNQLLGIN
jgi:hypothetical protein